MPRSAPLVARALGGAGTAERVVATRPGVDHAARIDREVAGNGQVDLVGFVVADLVGEYATRCDCQVGGHGVDVCSLPRKRSMIRESGGPCDGAVGVSDDDPGRDVADRAVAVQRASRQVQYGIGPGHQEAVIGCRNAGEPIGGVCQQGQCRSARARILHNQVAVGLVLGL